MLKFSALIAGMRTKTMTLRDVVKRCDILRTNNLEIHIYEYIQNKYCTFFGVCYYNYMTSKLDGLFDLDYEVSDYKVYKDTVLKQWIVVCWHNAEV